MRRPLPVARCLAIVALAWIAPESALSAERVTLSYAGGTFAARSLPPTAPAPRGGVVLLPGLARTPDDPLLIIPLAQALADHGWQVITIQTRVPSLDTPVAVQSDWLADTGARITAGIGRLTENNSLNNVAIGIGAGGDAVLEYALTQDNPPIAGWVAIMPASLWRNPPSLATNRIPGLLWTKPAQTRQWRTTIRGVQDDSFVAPAVISGARGGRWFIAERDRLAKRIRGWLVKNLAGRELEK